MGPKASTYVGQASPLDFRKKTQGRKNSKLKQKTQTQAKNSNFWHFSKKKGTYQVIAQNFTNTQIDHLFLKVDAHIVIC